MQISYFENHPIRTQDLIRLYEDLGWTAYTDSIEVMEGILKGTLWHMSAFEGERLVGLIRVIGDDCYIAYIQDILVAASHQRRGIGTHLIQAAFERFRACRQVVLLTDKTEKTRAFYESVGMRAVEELDCMAFIKV